MGKVFVYIHSHYGFIALFEFYRDFLGKYHTYVCRNGPKKKKKNSSKVGAMKIKCLCLVSAKFLFAHVAKCDMYQFNPHLK